MPFADARFMPGANGDGPGQRYRLTQGTALRSLRRTPPGITLSKHGDAFPPPSRRVTSYRTNGHPATDLGVEAGGSGLEKTEHCEPLEVVLDILAPDPLRRLPFTTLIARGANRSCGQNRVESGHEFVDAALAIDER